MKKLGILAMVALMVVALCGVTNAADTITIDTVTWAYGAFVFSANASIDSADQTNCTNMNWSLTNSSGYVFHTGVNTTGGPWNNTNVSITFNVHNLTDRLGASGYTINATCINGTGGAIVVSDGETFGADNNVPVCNFTSRLSNSVTVPPDVIWAIDGTNSSSATIQFKANGAIENMVDDTTAENWTWNDRNLAEGIYPIITATTSDGRNSTTCSLTYVEVDSDATISQIGILLAEGSKKQAAEAEFALDQTVLLFGGAALAIYLFKKRNN